MEGGRMRVVVPAVVLALAAGLRLWGLDWPSHLYADEPYYVFDAENYLGGGGFVEPIRPAPAVRIAGEQTWVHPPLGKWIVALLGIGPLGERQLGWRLPSVLFGVAGVGLLYALALQIWGSVRWAGFAALLLAVDGLHLVQSRIAMLDIFVTTFVTAGALFVVLDRRRRERGGADPRSRVERVFGSSYRLWAGVMLGAAVATKWTGVFALVFLAAISIAWELPEVRRTRPRPGVAGTIAASFLLVPVGVYLLSYGAFWYQHGPAVHDFWTLQADMLRYHLGHRRPQPESSAPWTWPLLLHPIEYARSASRGGVRTVVALGNPIVWWGFLALLPAAILRAVRGGWTWADGVAFGGYAALFLPWLLVPRNQFVWYVLPAVPFLCLTVVATLRGLTPRVRPPVTICFAGLLLAATVAFAPASIGIPVPHGWLRSIAWLPGWPR